MSKTTQEDLLEKLLPTLTAIDATADWHIGDPAIQARKCDIYKVMNANRALALKVYKDGMVSDAAPGVQYHAMMRCNEAVQHQSLLRAPKALAFLPDEGALLMDWQTAPTLRSVLWKKVGSPRQRLDLISAAAKWLRAFHELSGTELKPISGDQLTAKLQTQISRKPKAMASLEHDPDFQIALDRFVGAAANTCESAPHALLHGDFTPTNLLVDDTGVIGMDMWGARHGPVQEDIARMLVYLGVVSPFSFSSKPLASHSALVRAFTQGYGKDPFDPHSPHLPMVLLYQQLRRWLVYAGKANSQSFSPLAKWQLARNRGLCQQTLAWLDHCKP